MKNVNSLKNSRQFRSVYEHKKSCANRYLVMYVQKNNLEENRLGISVSKKVGNSVVRHRIIRLIRESYRLNCRKFECGLDVVIVARASSKGKSYREIEKAMLHLGKIQGIIKEEGEV